MRSPTTRIIMDRELCSVPDCQRTASKCASFCYLHFSLLPFGLQRMMELEEWGTAGYDLAVTEALIWMRSLNAT